MSVATQEPAAATAEITYEDLYRRWEEGNWRATEIDFSQDREGWAAFTEIQRKSAMWIFSMFFYGEDRVAETLSPTSTPPRPRSRSTSSPPSRSTRRGTPFSSTASSKR